MTFDDRIVMARPHSRGRSADPAKEAERKIGLMLQLRSVVRGLPALKAAVSGSNSSLLDSITLALDDERPDRISEAIDRVIDSAASSSLSKGPLAARNARANAIKSSSKRVSVSVDLSIRLQFNYPF